MANEILKGLSADDISSLLAKTRTRNQYGPRLVEFIESDEAAVNPRDTWPEMKDKNSSTMYQGFMKAVRDAKADDIVSVRQSDDEVYILHKERVAEVLAARNIDTDTDTDAE